MAAIWAGIDAGKTNHHCVATDESCRRLLSRRVANDEPELLELLTDVLALRDEATWGIDLVADRTRTVNRLRAQLTSIFPGLERVLDLTNTGPLVLLTGYQTPAALRRTGKKRLETWLRNRRVLRADRRAETAWQAASTPACPGRS
ncbi:transposase [Streptomyces sp. NPDC005828]|uniref:IS110 family transposase n=1 Tax=Streptomyces sp. NPDC005828 TaxID=3157071 RepID=UPI0033F4E0DD